MNGNYGLRTVFIVWIAVFAGVSLNAAETIDLPPTAEARTFYRAILSPELRAAALAQSPNRDSLVGQVRFERLSADERSSLMDKYLRIPSYVAPTPTRQYPSFPSSAFRSRNENGSSRVFVLVNRDGSASELYAAEFSHAEVAQAAVLDVLKWQFSPSQSDELRMAVVAIRWDVATTASAPLPQPGSTVSVGNPDLRKQLLERVAQDQAVRRRFGTPDFSAEELARVDADNLSWLRTMLAANGWPTAQMVGREAMNAAFLLVQHAPLDLQQELLPKIRSSFENGELPGSAYALLVDRIRVRTGQKQLYGSQARSVSEWKDGIPALLDIEDPENVDVRRKELGMQPIAEYLEQLKASYSRTNSK